LCLNFFYLMISVFSSFFSFILAWSNFLIDFSRSQSQGYSQPVARAAVRAGLKRLSQMYVQMGKREDLIKDFVFITGVGRNRYVVGWEGGEGGREGRKG
jgi:hypothetical protein